MTRTLMTGVYEHQIRHHVYFRAVGYFCGIRYILYQGLSRRDAEKARKQFEKVKPTMKKSPTGVKKMKALFPTRQWTRRVV